MLGVIVGFCVGGIVMFFLCHAVLAADSNDDIIYNAERGIQKCIDNYKELQESVPDRCGCAYLDGKIDGLIEALHCIYESEEN